MMRNDFNLSFLLSFLPLPLFPSSTEERKTCLKKYVKEDLTPFFKLNQLLNRACAQGYICICILILYLLCHADKLHDYKNKNIQIVESNGEEAIKEAMKLVMLTRPQSQFFEDELKITATDLISIKGN